MQLLYLDASGTAQIQDNSRHYVLLGLAIHESNWTALNNQVLRLKQRYCFPGQDEEDLEIHVKQFAVEFKEQEKIPNFDDLSRLDRRQQVLTAQRQYLDLCDKSLYQQKNAKFKSHQPYIHLSRKERSQLLEDAIELIAFNDGIKMFCEAIDKTQYKIVQDPALITKQAVTQVVARFDLFLQNQARGQAGYTQVAAVDHGLVIFDQDDQTEKFVQPMLKQYQQKGHEYGLLQHVIEAPFFASSAKMGGLQLADVAAYVVRRYLDGGAKTGSHEERHLKAIFHRFDRDLCGKLHGIRHDVHAGICRCLICTDRQHG